MSHQDTIAAIATPPGQGGIGVIRVSGSDAGTIAEEYLGRPPQPRYAHYANFRDKRGEVLDQGILLYFVAPASFTGEDVLEMQVHGGPVILDTLLKSLLERGCRAARPGEFSERAFLNGKIDLLQAEAIADLIAAESESSARAAQHSLQGELSHRIQQLLEQLTQLRMFVESALDFPEEEIDFLADEALLQRMQDSKDTLAEIRSSCRQGRLLREGLNIVITGRPNAGKSSLLNALAGIDSAIVSAQPGTTRDVIRERIVLDGVPLHVIDTAGLREADNDIEQEGVRRARSEIERADIVVRVVDSTAQDHGESHDGEILVYNKIDISGQPAVCENDEVWLSARSGEGLDLLKQCILQRAGYDISARQEGQFTARRRHIDALQRVSQLLDNAERALQQNRDGDIVAEELRLAQNVLAEITGEFRPDDLLGRIFSEFCIGK